jgi:hypothetical protein
MVNLLSKIHLQFHVNGGQGGRPEAMIDGKTRVSLLRKKGASGMSRGCI